MPKDLIEIREKTYGPTAYIAGTRIRVSIIARYYRLAESEGEQPEAYIRRALPHLSPAEIRAAVRYWRGHEDEIDSEITADREALEQIPTRI